MGNQLNRKVGTFESRLMRAVAKDDVEVIRYLLKKKDVCLESVEHDNTALSLAINRRHKEIVKLLVENGAKVTKSGDKESIYPLFIAVVHQSVEIIEILLQHGSEVNVLLKDDLRHPNTHLLFIAIQCSVESGSINWRNAATSSADNKEGASVSDMSPLAQRSINIIELLVNAGVDYKQVDGDGNNILHACARGAHLSATLYLLNRLEWITAEAMTQANNDGDTPIHVAIKHSNNNLAELLLQHGCDLSILDSSEENLISFTVMHQRETTMLETLLTLGGIDINKRNPRTGSTALHHCASGNKLAMARLILEVEGINVNMCDGEGRTALHVSANRSHWKLVQLLLDHGADVHIMDRKMRTPLHDASHCSDEVIITAILKHSGTSKEEVEHYINIQDIAQKTALQVATSVGNKKAVKALIENGAGVNIVDKFGNSPLYQAVQLGHNYIAELLLKAGAYLEQYNASGRGPLHACCTYPKFDIHMILILLEGNCDPINLQDFLDFLIEGGIITLDVEGEDQAIQLIHLLKSNPKPLKHWCRSVIRSRLPGDERSRTELKVALDTLQLPGQLMTYLAVKWL